MIRSIYLDAYTSVLHDLLFRIKHLTDTGVVDIKEPAVLNFTVDKDNEGRFEALITLSVVNANTNNNMVYSCPIVYLTGMQDTEDYTAQMDKNVWRKYKEYVNEGSEFFTKLCSDMRQMGFKKLLVTEPEYGVHKSISYDL